MPIVDVELVCRSEAEFASLSAEAMANALGGVLGSPPGHTWVRLRQLSSSCYAENERVVQQDELPVFVTLLVARPPVGVTLAEQVAAVTRVVATVTGRAGKVVHVEYASAGAGRQAFGGRLQ